MTKKRSSAKKKQSDSSQATKSQHNTTKEAEQVLGAQKSKDHGSSAKKESKEEIEVKEEEVGEFLKKCIEKYSKEEITQEKTENLLLAVYSKFPNLSLPCRYLGLFYFHLMRCLNLNDLEVWSEKRRSLYVRKALDFVKKGIAVDSLSLSCLLLRAMLVMTDFIERSTRLGKGIKLNIKQPSDSDIKEILQEFSETVQSARKALENQNACKSEDIIVIKDADNEDTVDPFFQKINGLLPESSIKKWEDTIIHEKKIVLEDVCEVLEKIQDLLKEEKFSIVLTARIMQLILKPAKPSIYFWGRAIFPGNTTAYEDLCNRLEMSSALLELPNIFRSGPASEDGRSEKSMEVDSYCDSVNEDLSIEREWNWEKEGSMAMCMCPRHKKHSHQKNQTTMKDRYDIVEKCWKKTHYQERRKLLMVPIIDLFKEVYQVCGVEGIKMISDALMIMKRSESFRACYWTCPLCKNAPNTFYETKEFLNHVEICHEEVTYENGQTFSCSFCKKECVGVFYGYKKNDGHFIVCSFCYVQESEKNKLLMVNCTQYQQHQDHAKTIISTSEFNSSVSSSSQEIKSNSVVDITRTSTTKNMYIKKYEKCECCKNHHLSKSNALGLGHGLPTKLKKADKSDFAHTCEDLVQEFTEWVKTYESTGEKGAAGGKHYCHCHARKLHLHVEMLEKKKEILETMKEKVTEFEEYKQQRDIKDMTLGEYFEKMNTEKEKMVCKLFPHMSDLCLLDKTVGETAISCIMKYILKKINIILEDEEMDYGVRMDISNSLQSFSNQPSSIFLKWPKLKAILNCLSFKELQMCWAYLVTQYHFLKVGLNGNEEGLNENFFEIDNSIEEEIEDDEKEEFFSGCRPLFEVSPDLEKNYLNWAILQLFEEQYPDDPKYLELESEFLKEIKESSSCDGRDPTTGILMVQNWWLDHLLHKSTMSSHENIGDELTILEWVFEKIVSTSIDEYVESQNMLKGKDRNSVIIEVYEQIAEKARLLDTYSSRRDKLENLQMEYGQSFKALKAAYECPYRSRKNQADHFIKLVYDILGASDAVEALDNKFHICSTSITIIQENAPLAHITSQKYAKALLDQELAILHSVQAMLIYMLEEDKVERENVGKRIKKLKGELAAAEREFKKVEAEGPSMHRRKDALDKATKEAEFRERLRVFKQRMEECKKEISTEEKTENACQDHLGICAKDMLSVQKWLQQQSTKSCKLEQALEQMAKYTEDLVDSSNFQQFPQKTQECLLLRMLRVAEVISMFDDRYAPSEANSLHTQLFKKAAAWVQKSLKKCNDKIVGLFEEIEEIKQRLVTVACIDKTPDITQFALEVIRKQIERATYRAKERAMQALLKEIEEESNKSKAVPQVKQGKQKNKKKSKTERQKEKSEYMALKSEKRMAQELEEQKKKKEREKEELEKKMREAEIYEAELRKRREELEKLKLQEEEERAKLYEAAEFYEREAKEEIIITSKNSKCSEPVMEVERITNETIDAIVKPAVKKVAEIYNNIEKKKSSGSIKSIVTGAINTNGKVLLVNRKKMAIDESKAAASDVLSHVKQFSSSKNSLQKMKQSAFTNGISGGNVKKAENQMRAEIVVEKAASNRQAKIHAADKSEKSEYSDAKSMAAWGHPIDQNSTSSATAKEEIKTNGNVAQRKEELKSAAVKREEIFEQERVTIIDHNKAKAVSSNEETQSNISKAVADTVQKSANSLNKQIGKFKSEAPSDNTLENGKEGNRDSVKNMHAPSASMPNLEDTKNKNKWCARGLVEDQTWQAILAGACSHLSLSSASLSSADLNVRSNVISEIHLKSNSVADITNSDLNEGIPSINCTPVEGFSRFVYLPNANTVNGGAYERQEIWSSSIWSNSQKSGEFERIHSEEFANYISDAMINPERQQYNVLPSLYYGKQPGIDQNLFPNRSCNYDEADDSNLALAARLKNLDPFSQETPIVPLFNTQENSYNSLPLPAAFLPEQNNLIGQTLPSDHCPLPFSQISNTQGIEAYGAMGNWSEDWRNANEEYPGPFFYESSSLSGDLEIRGFSDNVIGYSTSKQL